MCVCLCVRECVCFLCVSVILRSREKWKTRDACQMRVFIFDDLLAITSNVNGKLIFHLVNAACETLVCSSAHSTSIHSMCMLESVGWLPACLLACSLAWLTSLSLLFCAPCASECVRAEHRFSMWLMLLQWLFCNMHKTVNAVAVGAAAIAATATATALCWLCLLDAFPATATVIAGISIVAVAVVVVFDFIRHWDVKRKKSSESLEYRIFSSIYSEYFYFACLLQIQSNCNAIKGTAIHSTIIQNNGTHHTTALSFCMPSGSLRTIDRHLLEMWPKIQRWLLGQFKYLI